MVKNNLYYDRLVDVWYYDKGFKKSVPGEIKRECRLYKRITSRQYRAARRMAGRDRNRSRKLNGREREQKKLYPELYYSNMVNQVLNRLIMEIY